MMYEIEQLIDRYLAEGLSPEELAALSAAVHRDDVPEEWVVVREMIDTLSEGEDDYDLLMATRAAAQGRRRLWSHRAWRAAAAVALVVGVGMAFLYHRGPAPELAQVAPDTITPYRAPQPAPRQSATPPAVEAEEAPVVDEAETVAEKPVVAKTAEACDKTPPAAEPHTTEDAVHEQLAEVAVSPRRVYSTNLLDEIPE